MGTEFQFGKIKKFWGWMVVTAAQQREFNATEHFTTVKMVFCSVYFTSFKMRENEGKGRQERKGKQL